MDRKLYLELCQKVSVLKDGILGIKENVPDELKVIHNGIVYYPVAYVLAFDEKGNPQHDVILHDLQANSITQGKLERVTPLNKEEVIKLIKRNKNTENEALKLLMDFLVITKEEAEKIYQEEIENV
jgi:hypothetical protein